LLFFPIQSLDYDNCYNVPYKNALKTFSKKTYLQMEVMRWVLVGFIGVFTGVVALFIDVCVRYLFRLKFSLFEKVYHATVEEGNVITAFLLLLGFNVLFAIIASAFIVIEVTTTHAMFNQLSGLLTMGSCLHNYGKSCYW
jgi:chloride channel 6